MARMCGLVGIVQGCAAPGEPAAEAGEGRALRRMAAALRHRGPDGEGFFTGTGTGPRLRVFLGHLRLAIFDPSAAASQPMTDPSGRYTIIFNGAIYNYRELLAELGLPAGRSDTAALLLAWAAWGPKSLGRYNGMFAFALWDAQEQALYLCRDRFGEKPLYYSLGAGAAARPPLSLPVHLIFASEIMCSLRRVAKSFRK